MSPPRATSSASPGRRPGAVRRGAGGRLGAARATPAAERRVAIVLANYPNRDGRIANGVGLDTPASTIRLLEAHARGRLSASTGLPETAQSLVETLLEGVTNELADARRRDVRVTLRLTTICSFFHQLPDAVQQRVVERWGAPEADPHVAWRRVRASRCCRSATSWSGSSRRAATTSTRAPATTTRTCRRRTAISRSTPGCAGNSARTRSSTWASTAIWNGCRARRWRSRATACPRRCSGPLPHIYPFIVNDPGEGAQAKRRAAAVIVDHLTPPLDPRRDLRAVRRARAAGRRVLRGRRAGPAAHRPTCAARSWR